MESHQDIGDPSEQEAAASDPKRSSSPEHKASELTAIVLTYNEASNILDCIDSLRWTDRIVVIDCYSDDETVTLASEAGAEINQVSFSNFAQQRNDALDLVETDWVFFVDADERGSPILGEEIREKIDQRNEVAWYVPRHNYIFGQLTLGAGWYPDYQLRLFQRGLVRYERPVHEIAVVDGEIGYLKNTLIHYNYLDPAHFHSKQRFYTEYDAGVLKDRGIRPRPYTNMSQPLRHFWWRFITLKGYRDGIHGFRLSLYMAYYEWLKYRKLADLWAKAGPEKVLDS